MLPLLYPAAQIEWDKDSLQLDDWSPQEHHLYKTKYNKNNFLTGIMLSTNPHSLNVCGIMVSCMAHGSVFQIVAFYNQFDLERFDTLLELLVPAEDHSVSAK